MQVPSGWKKSTIGELCEFINGNGFKPSEWSNQGLPIIRIQNLNGSKDFNYYSGEPLKKWLVNPGQLLFAWAGTKGVSFGPKIWNGPQAVLNQHIFKLNPISDVNTFWFYSVLVRATEQIESCAHGFKSTLLHVQKSDITDQLILVPPTPEQQKIAQILSTWDKAIEKLEALIAAKQKRKKALMQQLMNGKKRFAGFEGEWKYLQANELFKPVSIKKNGDDELLAVTQDQGVLPRSLLERRVVMPEGSTEGYKLVVPGNFIISLRSFQGRLEYSNYRGLVSPAYTVLKSIHKISDDFYRHYFKSYDFIGHLAVAVIGIRDGKQISYDDFSFLKLPFPSFEEQQKIASVLTAADTEIETHQKQLASLKQQKKGLMQQLLTGKKRVKVDSHV